jgi:hypothetical protein
MSTSSSNETSSPGDSLSPAARVLYAGAALFVFIGGGIAAWIAEQWAAHPEARATQFGFEAPLWPAALLFVLVATAAGVGLLWNAAQRVRDGEDLFEQRHRRRSSDEST